MLLERDHVIGALDELAAEAAAGRGRVAFLVGEAGIGKTSVLKAFVERLGGRMRTCSAACEDLSAAEALTLLRDLPMVEPAALDRANDSGSRLTLFAETLARLAEVPTVLLVEDLHWADDGSIDFIRYAARRIAGHPLLIVMTSRNEDQGARGRLTRAAGDLAPDTRRRFDLDRLSSAAVGQMAAARGLIGSAIHQETGGNPLLVTEVLASGGGRPKSIDDLVLDRADRLDDEARRFLDLCAIIPRRVSFDQLMAAGASNEAVRACLDAGLLLPDGDGVTFRHEMTRRAVEEALSPLQRRMLHAAELARLDAAGASAARRLHHALGAGDAGRVRELAPPAAEQAAALGAHREAIRAWTTILNDAEAAPDPQHIERYVFALHVTGDLATAVAWQQRLLDIHAARGDALRHGDAVRFLSRLHYLNGDRLLADDAAEQAVTLLEPFAGTPELALAYANRAHLAMLADDYANAKVWSERAITLAEALGRDDILATVLNNYGTAMQYEAPDEAFALLDRSIALGLATGSAEHVARAYLNKGWVLMQARRYVEALATIGDGIAYCDERELDTWRDYMRGGRALSLLALGRWAEAEAAAEPVIASTQTTHLVRNPAPRALAFLRNRRGDNPAPLVDELQAHMAKGREAPRLSSLALIVAERAWTTGTGSEGALALLQEAASLMRPTGCPWDRAEIWHWRCKLGDEVEPPKDLPHPYACTSAEDAAAAFAALSMPFEQAVALTAGDADGAARGLSILDRLGAEATAARVRAELAGRGIRRGARGPRASTLSNGFGLTRREIDVLAALDKGWTNKEIGERLFVSAKTVDHHVSSILGKLGARTRGEAAATARSEGLIA